MKVKFFECFNFSLNYASWEIIQANSKKKLRDIKKRHRTKGVRDRQFTELRRLPQQKQDKMSIISDAYFVKKKL